MTQLLSATTEQELLRQLSRLDISVSMRSKGRTTAQTELFSIAYALSSIPRESLVFPLTVEHGDRPDFHISSGGVSIGVEHTEAVPENLARASVLREQNHGRKVYFLPRAVPGEPTRSKETLLREIKLDHAGEPWVGEEPEEEWAAAMIHFARGKVYKAAKPGFTRYERNWLLIYDNWFLPAVKLERASALFQTECAAEGVFTTFDHIYVLSGKFLCEIAQATRVHPVRETRVVT